MTMSIGFLWVPPLKFVEQIIWFFTFLISLLFGPFFSVYICVQFHLLQSNCNYGYFSHRSFVNFLKKIIFFFHYLKNKDSSYKLNLKNQTEPKTVYLLTLSLPVTKREWNNKHIVKEGVIFSLHRNLYVFQQSKKCHVA